MKLIACAMAAVTLFSGCASFHTYTAVKPRDGENTKLVFKQGVGTLTSTEDDGDIVIYPTYRLNDTRSAPTFSIFYVNKSDKQVDFSNANIKVFFRGKQQALYTFEERTAEIRSEVMKKQVLLAIVGGIAAGASAYAASHQTSTYQSSGNVWASNGRRSAFGGWNSTAVVRTYDPLAGAIAGGAVAAGTVVGINQIEKQGADDEARARALLQENTLPPMSSIEANLMIKGCCEATTTNDDNVLFVVDIAGKTKSFLFQRKTIESK